VAVFRVRPSGRPHCDRPGCCPREPNRCTSRWPPCPPRSDSRGSAWTMSSREDRAVAAGCPSPARRGRRARIVLHPSFLRNVSLSLRREARAPLLLVPAARPLRLPRGCDTAAPSSGSDDRCPDRFRSAASTTGCANSPTMTVWSEDRAPSLLFRGLGTGMTRGRRPRHGKVTTRLRIRSRSE
jgi:hypothetical protein